MINNTIVTGLVLVLGGLVTFGGLNGWKKQIETCQAMSAKDIADNEVTDKCDLLESQAMLVNAGIGAGIGAGMLGCILSIVGVGLWVRTHKRGQETI